MFLDLKIGGSGTDENRVDARDGLVFLVLLGLELFELVWFYGDKELGDERCCCELIAYLKKIIRVVWQLG